jgi:hypothetical protein
MTARYPLVLNGTSIQEIQSVDTINLTLGASLPLTSGVTGALPIANGGTNGTATPTAGAVPYGTGTAFAFTAAGTSGYYLQSNGSSAPTWTQVISGASTGKAIAMSLIFGF